MAWPALDSGRLLEACGDASPRGMTVHDRTRLTGELSIFFLMPFRAIPRYRHILAMASREVVAGAGAG